MKNQSYLYIAFAAIVTFTAVSADEPEVAQPRSGNLRSERRAKDLGENRIVNGQLAAATGKKWPFFVTTGQCGATLVAPDVVMSAAHCFNTQNMENGRVLIGSVNEYDDQVGNAEWRNVVPGSRIKHPQYNPNPSPSYDVMLFKIEKVTKPHLIPVKLNRNDNYPAAGKQLVVMGTGSLNAARTKYDSNLRWTTLKAVDHDTCNNKYNKYGGINKGAMLCAGAGQLRQDSCYGDSGGPLIDENNLQVGIVSYGAECADPNYPGVYTRVSGVIGWLEKTICELSDTNPSFCGGSSPVRYTATIQYDSFPAQASWYIEELATGKKVVDMPKGSVTNENVKLTKSFSLKAKGKYNLILEDGDGNGFSQGTIGYVNLVGRRNGKVVLKKKVSGQFASEKVVPFTAV